MIDQILFRMTHPWPTWSNRWWGIVLRVLLALVGIFVGAVVTILGWFAATFKKYPHEWTAENISLVVAGVTMILTSLAIAIRPSRLTLAAVIAVAVVVGVVVSGL